MEKLIEDSFQFLVAGGSVVFYDLNDTMITVCGLNKLTFVVEQDIIDINLAGGGQSFAAGKISKQVTLDFLSQMMGTPELVEDLVGLIGGSTHLFVEPNDDILSNYSLYDCVPMDCSGSMDTYRMTLNVTGDVIEEEK